MSSNKRISFTLMFLAMSAAGLVAHAQMAVPSQQPPQQANGAPPQMQMQQQPPVAPVAPQAMPPAKKEERQSTGFLHEASRLQGQQFLADMNAKLEKSRQDADKAKEGRDRAKPKEAAGNAVKRDFVVVEIYGFDNRIGAEIQFSDDSTLARVRKGSVVGGWTIDSITPAEVIISDGKVKKSLAIAFSGQNPSAVSNTPGMPGGVPPMPPMTGAR